MVVEFRLNSPAEVDAKYAKLTEQGYRGHREPFDAPWKARFAMIDDPHGNTISIFAPL